MSTPASTSGRDEGPPTAAFHAGECEVQARAGVREKVAAAGERMIRRFMPDQHRELFCKLPTLLVGGLDARGRPWATMLAGPAGFVSSPDEHHLRIGARPAAGDPLEESLALGRPLGLLGLEPHTRRRNRMNGTVVGLDAEGFTVAVDQSFGNCPKYIQAREPRWVGPAERVPGAAVPMGGRLEPEALALVTRGDTLFIASASPRARGAAGADGVDVSHRGGRPGFVRVTHDAGRSVLTVPDFRGNNMFNTLGNITANPRTGLLFIDHEAGHVLQLTGAAQVVWDGPDVARFAGAQRLLRFELHEAWWRPAALPLRWSAPSYAEQLADTATWAELGA